tara:strand:+ start:2065 stop:2940 length:876 start_codon:yes stop_codon:yes gene_type:complete
MAETNTYTINDTTPTETVSDNLTADEQDSLAVGEKMVEQQEQLLAGKYKDAQELEKAYIELQGKLGNKDNTEAAEEKSEDTESTPDNNYLEDGSVNYDTVTETYGEAVTEKLKAAGVDPWAISSQFHESGGEVTDEMVGTLTNAGFSEAAVRSYFAGRASESGYSSGSVEDISDAQINEIKQSVGGDQAYSNVVNWAKTNLDQSQTDAFDEVVNSGSIQAIKLAAAGLKAQYDQANGVEGRMVTGKSAPQTKDVFRSQAELVQAMNDRRYDRDPAYRQDVIEKLERSDVDF